MTTCQPTQTKSQEQTASVKPRYRVQNATDSYAVQVELPGVKKENLSINLDQNVLTVRGKRSSTVPADWKTLHRELSDVDYVLKLHLNVPVEDSKLSAKLADGILNLNLPMKEVAKPRTIPVS